MSHTFLRTLGAIKSVIVVENTLIISFYEIVDVTGICSCLVSFESDNVWSEREEINKIINREARRASETFSSARFRLRSTHELHLALPKGKSTRLEVCDKDMKNTRIFKLT